MQHVTAPTPTRSTRSVVIGLTGADGSESVLEAGILLAAQLQVPVRGVAVAGTAGLRASSEPVLRRHAARLAEVGGSYHEVLGDDAAHALAAFANTEQAGVVVLGSSATRWPRRSVAARAEALLDIGIALHVVTGAPSRGFRHSEPVVLASGLSARRQVGGFVLAAAALPLITRLLTLYRDRLSQAMVFLLYLTAVVVLAGLGGPTVGIVAAAAAFLLVNWYFTEPLHTLNVADAESVTELIIFLAVSGLVASLVSTASRRTQQALKLRTQATLLARASGTVLAESDPVAALLEQLAHAIGAQRVSLLAEGDDLPAANAERVALTDGSTLVVVGARIDDDARLLTRAFGDQMIGAMRTRELANQAAKAEQLRATNELRSALLRAVSHDLRTPLATAKIATSSLLSTDVSWDALAQEELIATADGEIDRLILIVENLLDAGRLQAGVVQADPQPIHVDHAVHAAIASLAAADRPRIEVHPSVAVMGRADQALLERVIANLLANALAADQEHPIEIAAVATDGPVLLRVVDHGPGIPVDRHQSVLLPFQRYGDRSTAAGVGLGLSICAGFCAAMGVGLRIEETGGGGATIVLELEAVV